MQFKGTDNAFEQFLDTVSLTQVGNMRTAISENFVDAGQQSKKFRCREI